MTRDDAPEPRTGPSADPPERAPPGSAALPGRRSGGCRTPAGARDRALRHRRPPARGGGGRARVPPGHAGRRAGRSGGSTFLKARAANTCASRSRPTPETRPPCPASSLRWSAGSCGSGPCGPSGRIRRVRTETRLLDADDRLFATVVHDHVTVATLGRSTDVESWTDVELRPAAADDELVDRARTADHGERPAAGGHGRRGRAGPADAPGVTTGPAGHAPGSPAPPGRR